MGLVAIDEAHHLRAPAYEVAQALAARPGGSCFSPRRAAARSAEYHALLRLVDPAPARRAGIARATCTPGELSAEVRSLLAGDHSAAERIARLFQTIDAWRSAAGRAARASRGELRPLRAPVAQPTRGRRRIHAPQADEDPVELNSEERDLEREVGARSRTRGFIRRRARLVAAEDGQLAAAGLGSLGSGREEAGSAPWSYRATSKLEHSRPPPGAGLPRKCWCSLNRARPSNISRRLARRHIEAWRTSAISLPPNGTRWWPAFAIRTAPGPPLHRAGR